MIKKPRVDFIDKPLMWFRVKYIGKVCSLILMTPLLKLKHFGSAAAKAKI